MSILENSNIIFYLLSYFISSIPFGILYTKLWTDVKLTDEGSGSIGATNVLRVLQQQNHPLAKKLAILTLLSDLLKIVVLLLIAKYVYGLNEEVLWLMSFLAIMGHCYSIFLFFEGGKGVATFFGVSLVMMPFETIIGGVIWGVLAKTIKISSISSLASIAGIILSLYFFNFSNVVSLVPVMIIYFIIFSKHSSNIARLINNEEQTVI